MRYFWWAEFQKRGAIHYHLMLVDAPFVDVAEARRWFTASWTDADGKPLAGIQAWTKIRSGAWFKSRGADYVMKDARKGHRKGYEQDYSRMPRNWRTFRSNQLTFKASEHQQHEDKRWVQCTAPPETPWHEKKNHIWVFRVDTHCPQEGGCRLTQRKVRRKAPTQQCPTGTSWGENSRQRLAGTSGGESFSPPVAAKRETASAPPEWYAGGETEHMHDTPNAEMPLSNPAAFQMTFPLPMANGKRGLSRG